ncbi:MAG: PspA/IM30 family protein [Pseudoprimorskyibacter sp.]|nr:PspA/IM30 family protein [Pseudoprimorskyibacter sp.]
MFKTFTTLFQASAARADAQIIDRFAPELIDEKIRQSEIQLNQAKRHLALLIQRKRSEDQQLSRLESTMADTENRAKAALTDGHEPLALEAAAAIATMENEIKQRQATVAQLEKQIQRLKANVQSSQRRIIDLRQGALSARSIHEVNKLQVKMGGSAASQTAAQEAQALIDRVMSQADPFEQAQILEEINQETDPNSLTDRLAKAGYGPATCTTTKDVMARLRSTD